MSVKIIAKTYYESRLEFFEEKLKEANKKLSSAISNNKGHETCSELGEKVSFYLDIVKMLKEE